MGRKKKEEKQRRKAEKRAEKKRNLEEENGNEKSDDDSDIEIIEDDNGVCTVSIQPRPIKLTIKTNGHQNPSTSNSMNDSDIRRNSHGSSSKPKPKKGF